MLQYNLHFNLDSKLARKNTFKPSAMHSVTIKCLGKASKSEKKVKKVVTENPSESYLITIRYHVLWMAAWYSAL